MSEESIVLKGYNRKVPKHCPVCGRELEYSHYQAGYDTQNGNPKLHIIKFCPKYWSKALSHYTISFDENGDEIISRY